jgi:hypothetical protein
MYSGHIGKDCQRRLLSRLRFVRACSATDGQWTHSNVLVCVQVVLWCGEVVSCLERVQSVQMHTSACASMSWTMQQGVSYTRFTALWCNKVLRCNTVPTTSSFIRYWSIQQGSALNMGLSASESIWTRMQNSVLLQGVHKNCFHFYQDYCPRISVPPAQNGELQGKKPSKLRIIGNTYVAWEGRNIAYVFASTDTMQYVNLGRSQWPRDLRHRTAASWLLGSWVRIPLVAWMFVCCVYMLCCPV